MKWNKVILLTTYLGGGYGELCTLSELGICGVEIE